MQLIDVTNAIDIIENANGEQLDGPSNILSAITTELELLAFTLPIASARDLAWVANRRARSIENDWTAEAQSLLTEVVAC